MARAKRDFNKYVAWAGPLMSPATTHSTPSHPPKRSKKRENSSEDDGPPILGDEEIKNEDYRCGGPALVALPAINQFLHRNDPLQIQYQNSQLESSIKAILKRWNIDFQLPIYPLRRAHDAGGHHVWQDTILVSARKHELDQSWFKACKYIRQLFTEHGMAELQVEILDVRALSRVISYPILRNDPFLQVWQELRAEVLDLLQTMEWTMLSVHRRGVEGEQPIHTIIICIREDSIQNWPCCRDVIVSLLDTKELSYVAVEILRDSIWQCSEDPSILKESDWDMKSKLGGSLGLHASDRSSSTFGGFLELQSPSGEWFKYGVTNFHCIYPGPDKIRWAKEGIFPGDISNNIHVDHPSLADHKSSLNYYQKMAADVQSISYFELKRRIDEDDPSLSKNERFGFEQKQETLSDSLRLLDLAKAFTQDKRYLGKVYAASGYRATSNSMLLDWALINVQPDRLSSNELPDSSQVPRNVLQQYSVTAGSILQKEIEPQDGMPVFKQGRRTGFTRGKLGALYTTHLQRWFKDDNGNWDKIAVKAYEIFSTSRCSSFADAGDSGSFVINEYGALFGLYAGGSATTGSGICIRARDLFEDIKLITGARDVRVPSC